MSLFYAQNALHIRHVIHWIAQICHDFSACWNTNNNNRRPTAAAINEQRKNSMQRSFSNCAQNLQNIACEAQIIDFIPRIEFQIVRRMLTCGYNILCIEHDLFSFFRFISMEIWSSIAINHICSPSYESYMISGNS